MLNILKSEGPPGRPEGFQDPSGQISVNNEGLDSQMIVGSCWLQLCESALHPSGGRLSEEAVPIAARRPSLTTWVHIKKLLRQQIGPKLDLFRQQVLPLTLFGLL